MKRANRIVLAVAILALAALACSAATGGGGEGSTDETPVGSTLTPSPVVLLSDDFSTSRWGIGTDADSSVEYVDDALQMIVYTPQYFVWSTPPGNTDYQNEHIEVTVLNNGTDSSSAFGIMCHKQTGIDNFYYVAIRPAGEYAIAKAVEGESDLFLTINAQWESSDQIPQNADSYVVGADCSNGMQALYVNGQQIATASDTSYTSGGVALFTWSGEEANSADVSFDNFLMTELP